MVKVGERAFVMFEITETPAERDGAMPELTRGKDANGTVWNLPTDVVQSYTFGIGDTVSHSEKESTETSLMTAVCSIASLYKQVKLDNGKEERLFNGTISIAGTNIATDCLALNSKYLATITNKTAIKALSILEMWYGLINLEESSKAYKKQTITLAKEIKDSK